jgi:hypothetical protein
MSALSVSSPFPIFTDIDGQPLEAGYVWIGTANLDPQVNPINAYWDAALTIVAVQPIRTLGGYPANSGTPARVYVDSDYSIRVMNKNGSVVYSAPAATERYSDVVVGDINASNVIYDPAGTGAVATTVQGKLRESVSVNDFGAVGDGVTDDTAAIRLAIDSGAAEINFQPGGIYRMKMAFITAGNVKLNGNGATIVQYHDDVNSTVVGGNAGEYKVSAAFFLKRGSVNVEITGFKFTTNDASFPALAATFGSYFPSIGGQFSDNTYIHDNNFSGGKDRCLFIQAGQNLRFENNNIVNGGFTVHVGFTSNIYFYDATSNLTNIFSPIAPSFTGNVFNGYAGNISSICAHLSGCIDFTFNDNKLLDMVIGATGLLTVVRMYANDFGPHNASGVAQSVIRGTCTGNIITGTFTYGMSVDGDISQVNPTWTASFKMPILVEGNNIQGIGNGIRLIQIQETNISNNFVEVTQSPVFIERQLVRVNILGNYFSSTLVGYNETTIYTGWSAGTVSVSFCGNTVLTPTGGKYAMNSAVVITWFTCSRNNFYFDGDVAGSRVIILTLAGMAMFNENIFNVETNVANMSMLVLGGSGPASSLHIESNDVVAINGTGASTVRFANPYNFKNVHIHRNNIIGSLIVEDSDRVFISNNTLTMPSANSQRAIFCDNGGYAVAALVEIHSNYILQPAALNSPCIGIASNNSATLNTLSKVTMNRLEGNSAGSLLTQTVYGELAIIGNTIINNGVGGTAASATAPATLLAL